MVPSKILGTDQPGGHLGPPQILETNQLGGHFPWDAFAIWTPYFGGDSTRRSLGSPKFWGQPKVR